MTENDTLGRANFGDGEPEMSASIFQTDYPDAD
jgi:hypothetical protein